MHEFFPLTQREGFSKLFRLCAYAHFHKYISVIFLNRGIFVIFTRSPYHEWSDGRVVTSPCDATISDSEDHRQSTQQNTNRTGIFGESFTGF